MAKKMAFVSICMAMSVICLFGASITPAKVAMLAVASVFCAVVISQFGPMAGFLHYLGTSLLALLLIPSRMYVLLYVAFVGYYPILKLFIERLRRLVPEWILKVLLFNVVLVGGYALFALFLLPHMQTNAIIAQTVMKFFWWIVLAVELIFVIYDVMLSYILSYYHDKLQYKFHF